jgi:hypothetical protein
MDLPERLRGVLASGAIGDAVGRPYERVRSNRAQTWWIRECRPWHWLNGPKTHLPLEEREWG